jgi:ATP adenylyltransferase
MAMDHLTTPWRYAYVTTADEAKRPGVAAKLSAWPGDHNCVFCNMIASVDYAVAHGMRAEEAEAAAGVIWRGRECFVCLNAFPYTSGHVMAMPYAHADRLNKLSPTAAHELMDLALLVERALEKIYRPEGLNFGLNLGRAAGAGVAGHLHMHAMPRWVGDTNFMTAIGETRVIPETLEITWRRVREAMTELE